MKCLLPSNINACPYYREADMECICDMNDIACSYRERESGRYNKNQYVRQERWYEQYYNKK